MKTRIETITPALATEWLEKHNTINRNLSQSTVDCYAIDMKNGRWSLTHQGLAFDTNGNLQDGQHRLWAIVFSGVTLQMNVTRDVPVEEVTGGISLKTMDSIDRNRVRTTGQQMGLSHGIKNANVVAAALRGIALIVYPTAGGKRLSTASSLYLYDQYGKDVEAVIEAMGNPMLRVSHVTAPLAMYHHGEKDKALELCRQLQTLENMSAAARTLRKNLDAFRGSLRSEKGLRLVSRCVKAFHNNEPLQKVHDDVSGQEFLIGMFPSLNRKIRESLTPCRNQPIKKTKNQ